MIPNEILHVRVRAKLRPSIYSDPSSIHSDAQVRVSFPGHNVSPNIRRAQSAMPPLPLQSGYDVEMDSSSTGNDSATGTAPTSGSSKGRKSSNGGVPVSVSGPRTRSRLRRQLSVPSQDGGGSQRKGNFSADALNASLHRAPGRTSATYEDIPRPLLHRISSASSNASSGSFTEHSSPFVTANASMASTSDDLACTTLKANNNSEVSHGAASAAEKYCTPEPQSPLPPHRVASPPSADANPEVVADDATIGRDAHDEGKDTAERRKKPTKAMKGAKLLFSPMAALQDSPQKMSYPSDGENESAKTKVAK